METFRAKTPELPRDFTLIFKGEKYKVSKFMFSMHSLKFRELLPTFKSDFLEIPLQTTENVFNEFLKAIHNEEFCITTENIYDLYKIAKEWKIQSLIDRMNKFAQENNISEDKLNEKSREISPTLMIILAKNINKAITMSSFTNLPFDVISKILSLPEAKISDHQTYYDFIKLMLDIHGKKATELTKHIDLKLIPSSQLVELLENPNLDKELIAPNLLTIAKYYVEETAKLEENYAQAEANAASLQNPDSALKKAVTRVKHLQDRLNECVEQEDSIEKDITEELTALKMLLTELEKKVRTDSQNQDEESTKAFAQIKDLCDRLEQLKHKDNKRSPQRRHSIDDTATAFDQRQAHLTPFNMGENPLDGILNSLISRGVEIKIIGSSSDHNDPSILVRRDTNDYWMSANKIDQFVRFDFAERQIKVSQYTIKTIKFGEDSCHMKSWIIEGSNDDVEYSKIDERKTDELNGSNKVVTFKCTDDCPAYRYIKIRMTDSNHRGDNTMALNSVEFFGIIIEEQKV